MDTQEATLVLPGDIARDAESVGLETEAILSLIREEIRRRRVDRFFQIADRLAALPEPVLTEEEIMAEVRAARAERRAQHANSD